MELGKTKCGAEEIGLEFTRYTRSFSFGRKRILIPKNNEERIEDLDSGFVTSKNPLKRLCSERIMSSLLEPEIEIEKSRLESLPQDILIRILCGVDHDDLRRLFHVSKAIREATLIAKQWHFAYSTPKKARVFRTSIDLENQNELDEIEAPNAPKQLRSYNSRLIGKNLADISMALFT